MVSLLRINATLFNRTLVSLNWASTQIHTHTPVIRVLVKLSQQSFNRSIDRKRITKKFYPYTETIYLPNPPNKVRRTILARGKIENSPNNILILFTIRYNSWIDGMAHTRYLDLQHNDNPCAMCGHRLLYSTPVFLLANAVRDVSTGNVRESCFAVYNLHKCI